MIGATVQEKSGIIQDEKNIWFQNGRTKTYLIYVIVRLSFFFFNKFLENKAILCFTDFILICILYFTNQNSDKKSQLCYKLSLTKRKDNPSNVNTPNPSQQDSIEVCYFFFFWQKYLVLIL